MSDDDEFCYCGQRMRADERRCSFCEADLSLVRRMRARERGAYAQPDSGRYVGAFLGGFFRAWLMGFLLVGLVALGLGGLLILLLLMIS
jgi:predicted lipid-binding transport protein (Tim44 family)